MKNIVKQINVSQHDFIITPAMYIGLKYIEVDLVKTIDSMEAFDVCGTNLLTMFPIVANEYYYFDCIHLHEVVDATELYVILTSLGGQTVSTYIPVSAYKDTLAVFAYVKDFKIKDVMGEGCFASSDFNKIHCTGIKINTS